jgi:hypothetical protein
MDTMIMLNQIFSLCIVPLLGILTGYLVNLIRIKKNDLIVATNNELTQKYLEFLGKTIETCVVATNQTYVNALKDKNAFDEVAQKEAFKMTYEAVINIINEDVQRVLMMVTDDLELYIKEKIEAEVAWNKLLSK